MIRERLLDLYICCAVSVLLRLAIKNDILYFSSCFTFGVIYGIAKGLTK